MKRKFNIVIALVLVLSIMQTSVFASDYTYWSKQQNKVKQECKRTSTNQNAMSTKDIVEVAVSDGRFNTLVTALKAADLVDALKGDGPFTVFAPTDDAFAKLPAGTVETLLKPENKDMLKDILTYHVLSGKVMAKDAMKLDGKEVTMLNGDKAKIEVRNGDLFIDGAKVIIADIVTKNGVIHVIDTVMSPEAN